MDNNKITIFPTPVWGFMLNDQKHQSKDYLSTLFDIERKSSGVKKSNFIGYQTEDNLNEMPIFRELIKGLEHIASNCIKHKAVVSEMWGNINYPGSFNGAHVHGGVLSGVFYLKTQENCGRLILCNPAVRGDSHFLRVPNYPIVPETLGCIMFPSWLEHYVEPNLSSESRVSLSFNITLA